MDTNGINSETQDTTQLPLVQRKRHRSLWYKDGSIILATPRRLFRVYRGILSQHSPIFRDMFSLPQPIDCPTHESMDGVPVVHLHDDPDELTHLLSALHNRDYYSDGRQETSRKLVALMRLSTKYRIRSLREQVIRHLGTHYVDTLEKLDVDQQRSAPETLVSKLYGDEMKHIPVFRETGVLNMLPIIFYYLAINWTNSKLNHMGDELEPEDIPFYKFVSKIDLLKVTSGRDKLRRAISEEIASFLYDPPPAACISSPNCQQLKLQFLGTATWREWSNSVDALSLSLVEDLKFELLALCADCMAEKESSIEEGRSNVWKSLPSYFGLAPWEQLNAMTAQTAQYIQEP